MAKVIHSIEVLRASLNTHRLNQQRIGFVPTMGALHEGHKQLIKTAREHSDIVVVSIYVNPTQFGPNEDFEDYPRQLDQDAALIDGIADYIFAPTDDVMYPLEESTSIQLNVGHQNTVMDGPVRPGHFNGVVTVVNKLFNIVQPDVACFGKKDAQQLAIIQTMVNDFHMNIEIIGVDIIRNAQGLAESSRNVYLSENELKNAPILYNTLTGAKQLIKEGTTDVNRVKEYIEKRIQGESLGQLDALDILTYPTLKHIDTIESTDESIVIAIAVKYDKARLIDNIIM